MQQQTRFVFKQSAIYSIGNILSKLSGILLLPLYLKYISEEEFGIVALFETIFQFILIFSGWGVKAGFSRWYHEFKTRIEKKQLFYTTYAFNFLTSLFSVLLIGGVLFLFSDEIFKAEVSSRTILFFGMATLFRLLYDVPFFMLKLEQKAAHQTGWFSLNIFLVLVTSFVLLEFFDMGLEGIYLGQLLAHFLTLLPMVPLIWRNFSFSFQTTVLKKLLNYGLPLAISNILTTILTLSDRHIINQFQNLGEVAGYSMAYKISNLVQIVVVASIITGFTNYYFKTMHEGGSSAFYQRMVRYFVVLISVAGLGIVLFSPEIIYVVSMGSEFFQSAVIIVPVLMLAMIFSGLRQLFTLPLNKHKQTRRISVILVSSAILNLAGNFALVPFIGKMGASVSTLVAQLFAMVWFIIEVRRMESLEFSLPHNLILLLVWGVLSYVGMQFFHLPLLAGWGVKLALILIFIVVLFFTKHISKEEISEVGNIYKKIRGRK